MVGEVVLLLMPPSRGEVFVDVAVDAGVAVRLTPPAFPPIVLDDADLALRAAADDDDVFFLSRCRS